MNKPNKLVLIYIRIENFASDKNTSLWGPFISYEENEVLQTLLHKGLSL